jgi:hypothetical protein
VTTTETHPEDLEIAEPPGATRIMRRGLLGAGIALVTAACQPSSTPAPSGTPPSSGPPPPPPPITGGAPLPPWPSTGVMPDAWHVAKRLTYGPTPAVMADIAAMGTIGWIDSQLRPTAIDDSASEALAGNYLWSRGTAAEISARGEAWRVAIDLPAATTIRAVHAKRQLFEMVVAFWWDHLNVDTRHDVAQQHCPSYDAEVIRGNALGSFSALLAASARSGAMLTYLDQASSRADHGRVPNENYARELMELHTVGVDGGYTDDDVKAVAHLLSGRTLTDISTGIFTFNPAWHQPGPFTSPTFSVLGWSRGTLTGQAASDAFIDHLAHHPRTARRLAHKLAVRFIGEHIGPDDAVVTDAANAYLANDTAIVAVLRSLLSSSEFAASADRRIRRPIELYAAAIRATVDAPWNPSNPDDTKWNLNWIVSPLGGMPHQWPTPDGYPDHDVHWVSVGALIGRWNLATQVASGGVPGFTIDWSTINRWSTGTTVGAWLTAASQRLGVPLDAVTRARLLAAVSRTETQVLRPTNDRWIFPLLLALLMQQPQFETR